MGKNSSCSEHEDGGIARNMDKLDVNDDEDGGKQSKETWTAGELLTEFQGGLHQATGKMKSKKSFQPRIPTGHAVMIASAKDASTRKVTSGGKPVMDYLGATLVRTLLDTTTATTTTS